MREIIFSSLELITDLFESPHILYNLLLKLKRFLCLLINQDLLDLSRIEDAIKERIRCESGRRIQLVLPAPCLRGFVDMTRLRIKQLATAQINHLGLQLSRATGDTQAPSNVWVCPLLSSFYFYH
jgi:hypothetical protein